VIAEFSRELPVVHFYFLGRELVMVEEWKPTFLLIFEADLNHLLNRTVEQLELTFGEVVDCIDLLVGTGVVVVSLAVTAAVLVA
jgi:hypothetical protein